MITNQRLMHQSRDLLLVRLKTAALFYRALAVACDNEAVPYP